MLKGISPILPPDLLKALAEMGHSDRLVIADGNFPAESIGKNSIVIRADGHGVPEVLDAVLALLPLDSYVENPVSLMAVMKGDTCKTPVIWDTYKDIIKKHEPENNGIELVERFDFYEKAKEAYLIIATGETAIYANIMLQKGVVV